MLKLPNLCKNNIFFPNSKMSPKIWHNSSRFFQEGPKNKIYTICLTGGPCAGKTTALSRLIDCFSHVYKVLVVPELATQAINAGVSLDPNNYTREDHQKLTHHFMKQMIAQENFYIEAGKLLQQDVLLITDRGLMDPFAYTQYPEDFYSIMEDESWTLDSLTNERYDLVLHMVTAADSAEEFYTNANNTARSESPDIARKIDKKIQEAWQNHHNYHIIDNSSKQSFADKTNRIFSAVGNQVGHQPTNNLTKKYLIDNSLNVSKFIPEDLEVKVYTETQDYLMGEEKKTSSAFVKERVNYNGLSFYSYTIRYLSKDVHKRRENKQKISKEVYNLFQNQKDKKKNRLYKKIHVFVYNNQNYVIEEFFENQNLHNGKLATFLRFDSVSDHISSLAKVPDFIPVVKEVSDIDSYHSYKLADMTDWQYIKGMNDKFVMEAEKE